LATVKAIDFENTPLKDFLKDAIENAPEYYIDRDIH